MVIDDVIVRKGGRNVELDVRVRNPEDEVANVTRAQLNVISRTPAAAVPQTSAHYDLLLGEGDNSIPVAHVLGADEVDRFTIRVGFTEFHTSCWFTATLSLRYNKNETTTSERFDFDSFFN